MPVLKIVFANEFTDEFVPLQMFGKDHWSTLAYIETVMVDANGRGFQVGLDARMRSNRHNHRVMFQECRRPYRPSGGGIGITMPTITREQGTILKDGRLVPGHDDWQCVQDFANLGYFEAVVYPRRTKRTVIGADDVQPGVYLHLSPKGRAVLAQLRDFKASGGNFKDFMPSQEYC